MKIDADHESYAVTEAQPGATLVALGVKTILTRSKPAPASLIGQRFAIHAGAKAPTVGAIGAWHVGREHRPHHPPGWVAWRSTTKPGDLFASEQTVPLPLGCVVATAVLADCVPIVDGLGAPDDPLPRVCNVVVANRGLRLMRPYTYPSEDITDQLPYGDFTPGRWGWCPTGVEACEPIPAKGHPGVWPWTR